MAQSKKVNEAIIGSPQYFYNALMGNKKDRTVGGGRKGYNVYRDFKYKHEISPILKNYDIEIKNYRIETTSKYIIECYDCHFITDMTDYSKEDFIELKENIQNNVISKLNIDNKDFFIRFLNKHLLQIRIKRDKPTDMNESKLKKMISEAVKETLTEKNSNVKEREYIMKYGEKYTEMYRKIWDAFSMLNEMSNTRLNSHIAKLLHQVIQALDKAGEYYNSQNDIMQ